MSTAAATTAEDVLRFWYADPAFWWKKDAAFDAKVRERFHDLFVALLRGEHAGWLDEPRSALAYVIVLDQFSRNMFRDKAEMYDGDARAIAAARGAVDRGFDESLAKDEKNFLYMPFMHSESLADQDRCVALFEELGNAEYTRFAQQHRDIVARFGRFPHRNVILGRTSTAEEVEFLKQPGSSF